MFMCQRNSFLTEFETEIISCESINDVEVISTIDPKALEESKQLYKVILKDTILFPEGGGQPDDRGFINDETVVRVLRNGTQAIHYVTRPSEKDSSISSRSPTTNGPSFKKGDVVLTKIDWQRRFDHMQQHSGQHLITAIADNLFGYQTTSWWLGTEECTIELYTKDVTDKQLKAIEDEVNAKIRDCVSVSVEVVELDDPKLQTARSGKNLPVDVKGQIRIVSISGIESNVCCGTHVSNLSQLQVIKLLNVVKKKGKSLLYFLAGNRVIDRFSKQFQREQKLAEIFSSSPADLTVAAEKVNVALRNSRKTCQILHKDLAAFVAKEFKCNGNSGEKLWCYHRNNTDLDFGMTLLREIGDAKSKIILITLKTEGNSGYLLLTGGEEAIDKENLTQLGEKLCTILDGKGALQRGSALFQARVNKIGGINKAVKVAQELIKEFDLV